MEEISEKRRIQKIFYTIIHVILCNWTWHLATEFIKLCVHHADAYKYRYMYWQQNYLHLFFLTKICFMKITSALIKNLKASTCPWTQHICNAVWRFLSTALKFTPIISRYFMTNLKEKKHICLTGSLLTLSKTKKKLFWYFSLDVLN